MTPPHRGSAGSLGPWPRPSERSGRAPSVRSPIPTIGSGRGHRRRRWSGSCRRPVDRPSTSGRGPGRSPGDSSTGPPGSSPWSRTRGCWRCWPLTPRSVAGIQAMAEHLPLATGSVDAVMISSAWHWMDADSTVDGGRAGAPPGRRAGSRVERTGPLGRVGCRPSPAPDAVPGDPDERRPRHRLELPSGSAFGGLETRVITWSLPMTRDQLIGLAGTYSTVITLSSDRRAEELARVEERVTASPSLQGRSVVELPMHCRCWRAVRQ